MGRVARALAPFFWKSSKVLLGVVRWLRVQYNSVESVTRAVWCGPCQGCPAKRDNPGNIRELPEG